MAVVDDREVRAIGERVRITLFQWALFPRLILTLKCVEDARDGRGTGFRPGQRLDDRADFGRAHPIHIHLSNRRVQFVTATMVAFKHLGVIATARPRHRQVRDLPHGRFQIAPVVPIALISTLLVALIGQGANERGDLLLSHTDERYTHCLLQPLMQHLFKHLLTSYDGLAIVLGVSHWYPPGNLC